MGAYVYVARDERGSVVRGAIDCSDEASALAKLRSSQLYVSVLMPRSSFLGRLFGIYAAPRAKREIAAFVRTMATLYRAGVGLARALEICADQCAQSTLREAITRLASAVGAGVHLGQAARETQMFDTWACAMLNAGEAAGSLEQVLERMAVALERDIAFTRKLSATLIYPATVACAAIALVLFLLLSVVPMFEQFYVQLHEQTPALTRTLLVASRMLRSPATDALIAFPVLGTLFFIANTRDRFDRVLLGTPIAGSLLRKCCAARFARVSGMLLGAGLPATQAVEIAREALPSSVFREHARTAVRAIEAGMPLSLALTPEGLYEPVFLHLARAGEEAGSLDEMLLRLADHYDMEVDSNLSTFVGAIEPIMILLLGCVVAFIVAALFVPLYSLIGNIK